MRRIGFIAVFVVVAAMADSSYAATYSSVPAGQPPGDVATCSGTASEAGSATIGFSFSCDRDFWSFELIVSQGFPPSQGDPGVTAAEVPGFECSVGRRRPSDPFTPSLLYCKTPGRRQDDGPPPYDAPSVGAVSGSLTTAINPTSTACVILRTIERPIGNPATTFLTYGFLKGPSAPAPSFGPKVPCESSPLPPQQPAATVDTVRSTQPLSTVIARGLPVPAECRAACTITSEMFADSSALSAARLVRVGRGVKTLAAAGRTKVPLKLTRTAKARFKRLRRVSVRLVTRVTPKAGGKTITRRQRITLKR